MSKIKNINLEFSCPEQRSALIRNGEELICEKCTNHVIDFTSKSNEELKSFLSQSVKPVCGIFRRRQLSQKFIRYAAAGLFVSASSLSLSANAQDIAIPDISPSPETDEEHTEFLGTIIETMPEPIGGNEKFFEAISQSLNYPKGLMQNGKVYVQFVVDTTGRMTDIEVIRGFNQLADKAALEAISSLNYPFKPGEQRGVLVRTRMVIPIIFTPENK